MNPLLKFASLAVASLVALSAHAQLIHINTGSNLGAGDVDLNYRLVSKPINTLTTAVPTSGVQSVNENLYKVTDSGFPFGPWVSNTATGVNSSASKWIGPGAVSYNSAPSGYYIFQTTFDLTNASLASTILSFRLAVDNQVTGVFLNGALLPSSTFASMTTFSSLYTFSGAGSFIQGSNSLGFQVLNLQGGTNGNPTGLRVEGTVSFTAVPEPSTYAAIGAASLFVVGMLRRRKAGPSPVAA